MKPYTTYKPFLDEEGRAHIILISNAGATRELVYVKRGDEWTLDADPEEALFIDPEMSDADEARMQKKLRETLREVDPQAPAVRYGEDIGRPEDGQLKQGWRWRLVSCKSLGYFEDGLSFGYSQDSGVRYSYQHKRELVDAQVLRGKALRRAEQRIRESWASAIRKCCKEIAALPRDAKTVMEIGDRHYTLLEHEGQHYVYLYTPSDSSDYFYRCDGVAEWVSGITTFGGGMGREAIEDSIRYLNSEIEALDDGIPLYGLGNQPERGRGGLDL